MFCPLSILSRLQKGSTMFESLLSGISNVLGWIVGSSWTPPTDFDVFAWIFSPQVRAYGAILIGLAVLELIRPHRRKTFDRESVLSGVYLLFSYKVIATVLVVLPSLRALWVYWNLPSLHLDRVLPLPIYMVVGALVASFVDYWAHRWQHTIPCFWHIHKIHHSPSNLNWSTRYHIHFAQDILHRPLTLITILFLGTQVVAPFGMIMLLTDYFQHANIDFNFGKLNYLFATPQVHRFHHSTDPAHYNKNLGATFMVWDQLFGTFYFDPDKPPQQFGLDEELPKSFIKQQLLPIVWIARDAKAWFGRRGQQESLTSVRPRILD
jgi:sterol desaturase/sphingolipid hydroxylase (fatty acid hydroxylase superfamily)